MSFLWTVALCSIALAVVKISNWLYRWSNPKCNGKLPPGSMGFPIVGETIEFFKSHGCYEISPFVKKRMSRYGPLFRTNLFGSNTVVLTEPDVIFEVFRQENKSFMLSYPSAIVKPFGKDNLFLEHGGIHKQLKQITLQLLGSEGLKRNMIRDMDRATRDHLRSKASQGSFDAKDAVKSLILAHFIPKMISNLKPETRRNLLDQINAFNMDWFQSPFRLTTLKTLYRAYIARREAVKVLNDAFTRRKASRDKCGDFLDTLVEELEKESVIFDQGNFISLMFGLLVLSKDSTSIVICMAIKFISENPKALAELKREHEAILQNREDKESGVTWEEYRHKMIFTNMSFRRHWSHMENPLRRDDMHEQIGNGYTIPAGWIAAVVPSAVHFDPTIYENHLEFNPWRWEGKELRSASKTFMVFGAGARQCVGADSARLQMSIFIHHLVTKYDFSLAQEVEFVRSPFPHFPKGLPINISESPKSLV
ncbi:unnamed protein product [Microthlaspi erraticum]|uniref:Cytochrome P450 n=1 Tax=Microthlaspi erraticum TaxID=1685480 RepID=A0A6D2HND2_9BRAS|nr:unnamed protein product [Microthlaspi erraticum]